jgi:predicted enzyme related to lactoylglutathione lyase
MTLRIQCVCIDSNDPARLASFWQSVLGWRRTHETESEVALEPPAGSPEDGVSPDLLFLRVPEGKERKNRLHLDLRPTDQAAELARLEELGARRVAVGQGPDVSWIVLADPEGNEFDLLRPLTPEQLQSL